MSEVNTEKLVTDLKVIARDTEELIKASAGHVGEKAQEARARLSAAIESTKAACRRLEERAIEGAKATDKVIREHPYQSIGVAFGIGMLIGVLVTRK